MQRSATPLLRLRFPPIQPSRILLALLWMLSLSPLWVTAPRQAAAAAVAVLRGAWVEHRGEVFTVHLRLGGRPRWTLARQFGQLQIDLLNTRSGFGPNQFLHTAVGSLGTVRITDGGERLRMQIDVTGNCDYVVGRQHDQLIVSLARRGAGADLAYMFTRAQPDWRTAAARRSAASHAAASRPVRSEINTKTTATRTTPPRQIAAASTETAAPIASDEEPRAGGRPIVVVDPGHGGFDPGTRSASGLLEKELALQIGQRLAGSLVARGVNPVMTRDSDIYLTLAQRTAIANRAAAELFVSVHLNSSPNPGTTGMEVYYLNNTTDRATIRLARMENAADNGAAPLDSNLNYILSDLQQQYKATESALLAQMMEQQAVSALQAAFGGEIRGLGARRGPFYVLVGPRVPAVLVECGFLSNAAEAQRLSQPAYQQAIADALAGAVVHYLNQDITAGTL